MIVILATWQTELLRKIMIPGQPGEKNEWFARAHVNGKKLGMVVHAYHPSYKRKCKIGGSWFRAAWAKSESLSPKYPQQKGLEGVSQVVDHLPSKCEALSSKPSTGPQKYNKCKYKNKKGHEFIKFFFKEKKSITVLYVRKHPYFLRYILKYAGESWYTWDFL
jgi:hypothetical protein